MISLQLHVPEKSTLMSKSEIHGIERRQCSDIIGHTDWLSFIYIWTHWSILCVLAVGGNRGILDAIHGLKLAQSLHRVDVLLLRGPLDLVGLAVVLLLSLHQRLLLGSLHPPGDSGHIQGLHIFALLVLCRGDVGSLDSGDHCVHQVLSGLDKGHGAVQLGEETGKVSFVKWSKQSLLSTHLRI